MSSSFLFLNISRIVKSGEKSRKLSKIAYFLLPPFQGGDHGFESRPGYHKNQIL